MEKLKHQEVNKELLRKISIRIKELRKQKGVSQEIFVTDTGINIGRIESCKSNFSVTTLQNICNYFEITLEEFFSKGFDD
ncbi:MAG: helix-turn-helix transcriptional regulator [Flavobacteriales bacterium]|nr:helix-turn-helix transcriptional regulator [Flavobacteriales bacterium]